MTSTTLPDRAAAPATHAGGLGPHPLAGTGTMIRLALRRERIALLSWVLVVVVVASSTVAAIAQLYPDEASRAALAGGIAANPAFLVITGPISDTSIGGVSAWRMGVIGGIFVSLMALFTVIRRTRADEEAGRTELVAAGVLGRAAPLAAAVVVAGAASLLIGLLVAAAWSAQGEDVAGSLAFGLALAGPGLVFTAVAALAAQLVESARAATGIAGAALGVVFGLRAIGDVGGVDALSWLSPLGWVGQVQAFGGNRWWVLLLFVALAGLLLWAAVVLLGRRDLGLAIWAARPGPATNARLRSPWALALRLHQGPFLGWLAGFIAFGAATGAIADSADSLLNDSPQMTEYLAKLGGTSAIVDAVLAADGGIAGILAGVYAITAVLRMSTEETAGRAAPVLATAVGRPRWMAGHLGFAFAGSAVLLLVCGVVTGMLHGLRSGDFGRGFSDGMASTLATVPAAWVMGGLAALLFGAVPRLTSLAWAALAAALLLGQLGRLLQLPQWLMDLSPFTHIGPVPADPVNWTATMVLTLIAVALTAAGITGFRRRDVSGG